MASATATATEMQNNFGKYLNMVMNGTEVVITKNGKEVGRFVPKAGVLSYLTDSLVGILHPDDSETDERESALRKKYESFD